MDMLRFAFLIMGLGLFMDGDVASGFALPQEPPEEQAEADRGAADDNEDEIGEIKYPGSILEGLNLGLEIELARLQSEMDLDEATVEKLAEAIAPELNREKGRIKKATGYLDPIYMHALSPTLLESLSDKARALTPGPNGIEFETYQAANDKLGEICDLNGQQGVVIFLDDHLSLSEKQTQQLTELYAESWNRLWNDQVAMMLWNDYSYGEEIIQSVDEARLAKILTPNQIKVFNSLKKFGHDYNITNWKEETACLKQIKSRCGQVLELRFDEMDDLLSLTDKQKRILSFAKKGAGVRVADAWAENKRSGRFPFEFRLLASRPCLIQCVFIKVWEKTVSKILTEDQTEKWQQRENQRLEFRVKQACNLMAYRSMEFPPVGLNLEECGKLATLFNEHADLRPTLNASMITRRCFLISWEEFSSKMPKPKRKKFRPHYNRMKQYISGAIAREEATAKAEEEDNDKDED